MEYTYYAYAHGIPIYLSLMTSFENNGRAANSERDLLGQRQGHTGASYPCEYMVLLMIMSGGAMIIMLLRLLQPNNEHIALPSPQHSKLALNQIPVLQRPILPYHPVIHIEALRLAQSPRFA